MAKDINKILKIVLMVCAIVLVLAISGSMVYYFAFAKPANEKAEIRLQEQKLELEKEKQNEENTKKYLEKIKEEEEKRQKDLEEAYRKEALYNCLDNAYENYTKSWNEECKRLGKSEDCSLPMYLVERLDELYAKDREQCFKLYGPD